MLNKDSTVFVAGHNGMVGSAIVRALEQDGFGKIITASRSKLDLLRQTDVEFFFQSNKIDHVVLAAAKVGGILANNTYPAEFIYQNLMIQSNVIHAAHISDVNNLVFLGSSCIYPRSSIQPIQEDSLLSEKLEPTNEPYAIAKIAGIKLCESYNRQYGRNYRSIMPTNLYGPNDNFHPTNSHVLPGLIRRFHAATIDRRENVIVWGSGKPFREFLHVDDLASACLFMMKLSQKELDKNIKPMQSHINVGTGVEFQISEVAELISKICGFRGDIIFDSSKPDGTPRKLLDVSLMSRLGWKHSIELSEGLTSTYDWYLENIVK